MEVDARRFADVYVDDAMAKIGRHYGEKLEGGDLDTIIEELVDEYVDSGEKPLTRLKIGTALKERDLNTSENMKKVIASLIELGVKLV